MDARAFHVLAVKVLTGSASEAERAELMRARTTSPEHATTWAQLLEAHVRAQATLAAHDARLEAPPAPVERLLASLDPDAAKPAPPRRRVSRWGTWLPVAVAACAVVAFALRGRLAAPADPLDRFLTAPLDKALTMLPGPAGSDLVRDAAGTALLTPAGITHHTRPVFWWRPSEADSWRFSIRDVGATTPPMVFENTRPPLELPPGVHLNRNGVYAVSLQLQGTYLPAKEQFFTVAADATAPTLPSDPAGLMRLAHEALTADPARPGDALAALLAIPPESVTDATLRLRLWCETLLGRHADAELTRAALSRPGS